MDRRLEQTRRDLDEATYREHSAYFMAATARAWARRWKRAAKDVRGQRQVLQDILNTTIETTNADLKDLRARLEKWRTAERCTGEEPLPPPCRGIRITHWAEVPEGEE